MEGESLKDTTSPSSRKLKKIGSLLIVLSFVFYGGILLIPFVPMTIGSKTIITSTLIILGEGSFWIGCFILGKEVMIKYKKYLNPLCWFQKKHH
jgi:hypothetical protein